MATVRRWTGRETRALRDAHRLSVRGFAEFLGVSTRTVASWDARGTAIAPRLEMQEALDTALERASDQVRERFAQLLPESACDRGVSTEGTENEDAGNQDAGNQDAQSETVRRRSLLTAGGGVFTGAFLPGTSRVVQALQVTSHGAEGLNAAVDTLDELIEHYAQAVATDPAGATYRELLSVRAFASTLLSRSGGSRRRIDVVRAAGWLSNLLAIATKYLGDHASALVWCADAERRSYEAGSPELAGWAALTRATIAYYRGQRPHSVTLACQGQHVAPPGTIVHARLTAQEMRARAMIGDADGMREAQRRAATALARLPERVPTTGAFSIQRAEDPPYTATSLLLVGRFEESAAVTSRVLETVYRPQLHDRDQQSSNYARTLLILGLARAGLGLVDEAAEVGRLALDSAGSVWPTMVLAGKLNRVLTQGCAESAATVDFGARYEEVARHADGPTRQTAEEPAGCGD